MRKTKIGAIVFRQLKNVVMVGIITLSSIVSASDIAIFRAMEDELQRSMEKLKFDDFNKPYFLSYRLVDSRRYYVSSSLGALLKNEENTKRQLVINLRVGDYKTDSSHLFELNFGRVQSLLNNRNNNVVPIESDYTEIRRQLWLATDQAYKKAVQHFAKKKALLAGKNDTDRPDDFLAVKLFKKIEDENISSIDIDAMANKIQVLSKIANEYPKIQMSEFDWLYVSSYTRFVNSEGTRIGRNDNSNRILVRAETQTSDGEPLFEEDAIFASTFEAIPKMSSLKKRIKERFDELSRRQKADPMKTYVGPVLFRPAAAAELIRQTIAKQALAYRSPEKDPSIQIQGFAVNTLQGQMKQRLLPRGFSIVDDPLANKFEGQPLLGGFWADDQGVKASPHTLIKNGRLVNLLSERSPIAEIAVEGGNHMDGSIAASNLIVRSRRPLSETELLAELFELSEELELDYAIVIERLDGTFDRLNKPKHSIIFGGSVGLTLDGLSAFKLYKDGRKEILRQVQLANFDIRSLKNIVAAGDDLSVYSAPAVNVGRSFFFNKTSTEKYDISSFVVPSLLFEDLSLSPQENGRLSLPVSDNSSIVGKSSKKY